MRTGIAAVAMAAALLFAGLGAAGAQVPIPLAPPTAAPPPPPPPPGSALSPILTQPGAIGTTPLGPHPTYPAPTYPGPLTQQQLQAYRTNLVNQQRQLEQEGVDPASPRYRDIQQQLNRLGQ